MTLVSHRRRMLREIAALTVAVWTVSLILWMTPNFLGVVRFTAMLPVLCALTFVVGVAFSGLLYLAIGRASKLSVVPRFAVIGALSVAAAAVHGLIDAWLIQVLGGGEVTAALLLRQFASGVMTFVLIYLLYAVAVGLMLTSFAFNEHQRLLAEARSAAHQAQLAALRFQLNPHFLFNTLNALSSLIVTGRNDDAEMMTVKLSDFLRASLETDPEAAVPLDEELATTQSYLDIESVRFGERLSIEVACPAPLLPALVPSFILQPLVENAVKYAVAPSRRPVTISITAAQDGEDLVLTVADDGGQAFGVLPKAGTGVGLENTRRRLAAFYGEGGRLEAMAKDVGFIVTVRLPLTRSAAIAVAA